LLKMCARGDDHAWQVMVSRYQPLIASLILRTSRQFGPSGAQHIDDLIQETFVRLCDDNCRRLRTLDLPSEAAFADYLKVTCAQVVMGNHRAEVAMQRGIRNGNELLNLGTN